jgi:LPPG:FO 2-phospho-L-lactate transferase
MNIVTLAGGVGGAKLADGLAQCLSPHPSPTLSPSLQNLAAEVSSLTVIVNTGDDFDLWGLRVCPDLDTVMYTLAGVANVQTGWGIEGDTFETLEMLKRLGEDTWFRVGDRDLAIDLRRTLLLRAGQRLTQVTELLCQSLGMSPNVRILPMTDTAVATLVETDKGTLAFQDYFVHRAWQPVIRRIYLGHRTRRPLHRSQSRARRRRLGAVAHPIRSSALTPSCPWQIYAINCAGSAPWPCRPLLAGKPSRGLPPRCSAKWDKSQPRLPWHSTMPTGSTGL